MSWLSSAWDKVSSPTGIATVLGGAGTGLTMGLLGGGGSAPSAPDFTAAAEQTAKGNLAGLQQQTAANRPDQTNPWGSVNWESYDTGQKDAMGNPITGWRQNTSLAAPLDAANQAQMGLQQDRSQLAAGMWDQAAQQFGQQPDWGNLQSLGGSVTPFSFQGSLDTSGLSAMPSVQGMNQAGVDAVYGQAASRLDPQFAQRQSSLETQLVNQGLKPGDAAYDAAIQNFDRSRNDAYGSALNNAVTQGAQIGNQMFNQGLGARQQGFGEALGSGNFYNQAGQQQFNQNLAASQYDTQVRNAQIADASTQQNWGLNNINTLLQGQQVSNPTFGSFSQAGAALGPNYLGAAGMQNTAAQNAYQTQQQSQADQFGGLAQLGAAAIPFAFSDARLKTDIERHGVEVLPGVQLATWRWADSGEPDVGVIAQDVAAVRPDLVRVHESGYLQVNYSFPSEV